MTRQPDPAALAALDQRYTAREATLDEIIARVRAALADAAPDEGPERVSVTIGHWLAKQPAEMLPLLAAHALLRLVRQGGAA